MSYYLPFNGPIADYMREHYDELSQQFFEHALGTPNDKSQYVRKNGLMLYKGSIKVVALKLCRKILDENERRIAAWPEGGPEYRTPFPSLHLSKYQKMTRWDDFLKKFDNQIEQCFFNIAYPGASITYHYGVAKHFWRTHVCFMENPGFTFDIQGELRKWKEGMDNSFMFDDGNLNHGVLYEEMGVENPRVVCILDIKK